MSDDGNVLQGKKKPGRKPIADPFIYVTVGLVAKDWEYVNSFCPGQSPSAGLRDMVDRSRKFRRGNKA